MKSATVIAEVNAKLQKPRTTYDNFNIPSSKKLFTTVKKRGSSTTKRKRGGQQDMQAPSQAQADEIQEPLARKMSGLALRS